MPAQAPQPPPRPPDNPKIFSNAQNQTEYAPKFTRATSTPSTGQFPGHIPRPPPDPPSSGASASSNPLGSAADVYLMKNYIAASTQHLADRLTNIDKNQRLLAEAQANLGPTNTLIQQAFLNVDARQAASFSASSSTVINPTVIYATGGNGGPIPPPPPGAGAAKMISNMLPPNVQIPEASSYIGTPRRRPGERAPRGERSTSASAVRGRPRSIKPLIKPPEIEVTPVAPAILAIKILEWKK